MKFEKAGYSEYECRVDVLFLCHQMLHVGYIQTMYALLLQDVVYMLSMVFSTCETKCKHDFKLLARVELIDKVITLQDL